MRLRIVPAGRRRIHGCLGEGISREEKDFRFATIPPQASFAGMKMLLACLSLVLCASVLSACGGGYPMQVESRDPTAKKTFTMQERLLMHQRVVNSRGAW